MPDNSNKVSLYDGRPFFEKALHFGVQNGIIDPARISDILEDAPKGMVQIADFFGSQYLRPDVETALARMVNLVSLYLEEKTGGDLKQAAQSLRDNTFLSHSRGGSELLKKLFALPEDAIIGNHRSGQVKDFLEKWSRLTPVAYRKELKKRISAQDEIGSRALARRTIRHVRYRAGRRSGRIGDTHRDTAALERAAKQMQCRPHSNLRN